jgi:protein-tyrosine phosphatase
MGGYPVTNGTIRWKALIRSDNTAQLNLASRKALIDYGVRTVIDLRFQQELMMEPSPFMAASDHNPDFYNIPMDEDQDLVWPPRNQTPAELMSDLYRRMLEANRGHIAAVITRMAESQPGGILFNCYAGKDRTGLIAAMVLGILGASTETIIYDYALTTPELLKIREKRLGSLTLSPDKRAYFNIIWSSQPETMRLTLDYLDQRYGGIQGFLATTPLTRATIDALRDRLIERKP